MSTHTIVPGKLLNTRSVSFNGVDEYAYVDSPAIAADTQGVFSMWVYVNSLLGANGQKTLLSFGGSTAGATPGRLILVQRYQTAASVNNCFEVGTRKEGDTQLNHVIGTTPLSVGWHHLIVQSNGSAWKIFLNGVEESLTSFFGGSTNTGDWLGDANPAGTQRLAFGVQYNGGVFQTHADCRLNQVYYRSTPFTAGEAALAAANPLRNLRKYISGLVACWPMAAPDDGTGTLQEQVGSLDLTTVNMDAPTNYIAAVP